MLTAVIGYLGLSAGVSTLVGQNSFNGLISKLIVYRRNSRTGRIVFQNPNPLPAQTYLDKTSVIAHLQTIERTPASSEAIYRRATTSILRWLFKEEDGYDVVQEDNRESSVPDHVVFKIERRAGSSFYAYDFLMVECKRADYSWDVALEHCTRHCENTDNESKKVYAMIQIGLTLQFYKWVDSTLTTLTNKLHVRLDVDEIIAAAEYLRTHPLPVVNH